MPKKPKILSRETIEKIHDKLVKGRRRLVPVLAEMNINRNVYYRSRKTHKIKLPQYQVYVECPGCGKRWLVSSSVNTEKAKCPECRKIAQTESHDKYVRKNKELLNKRRRKESTERTPGEDIHRDSTWCYNAKTTEKLKGKCISCKSSNYKHLNRFGVCYRCHNTKSTVPNIGDYPAALEARAD